MAAAPLRTRIAVRIEEQPLALWIERFREAGVPVAPVLSVDEAMQDAQLQTRRPSSGPVRGPFSLGEPVDAAPPRLGEHTQRWLS